MFESPVVIPAKPGGGDWDFGDFQAEIMAHPTHGLTPTRTPTRSLFGQQPNFAGTIGNGTPAQNFSQGVKGTVPMARDWIVPASLNALPIVPLTTAVTLGTGALAIYAHGARGARGARACHVLLRYGHRHSQGCAW